MRIGHFAFDAAGQISKFREQPPNTIDWFWLGPTCNWQWERMVRRTLPIVKVTKWVDLWNQRLPGGKEHARPMMTDGSVPPGQVHATTRSGMIPFLPSEKGAGLSWLRSQGWTDGEPFVCLLVRDSAFLANDPLQNKLDSRNSTQKWSYHNYRDSNIEDYVRPMEWLADQGVWVLRMGRIMERPIPTKHSRIVDYAFNPGRNDLLDIWLFANCTGCISTGTGLDVVSFVYGIPNLFLNADPIGGLWSYHECIWVPKHLSWDATGLPLTLSEHLRHNYGSSYRFAEAGIRFHDLEPEELMDAVQEFWHHIDGSWIDSPEDEDRQKRFWTQLKTWKDYERYHHEIHPKSMVGSAWLRSKGERFFDAPAVNGAALGY
jgi:putative glycosyltransferase (TIGR04372 family)